MTHSNNTTRARAHEAKSEKVRDADKQSKSILECLTKDSNDTVTGIEFIADAHDRAYRATWSGPDTEPEDSIDAYRLLYGNSIKVAVIASAIIFTAFGLGLGYLLFHP